MRYFLVPGLIIMALFFGYLSIHIAPLIKKLGVKKTWLCRLIAALALIAVFVLSTMLKSPVIGFMAYLFGFLLLYDIIALALRLLFKQTRARAMFSRLYYHGLMPAVLALLISVGGYINVWTSTVTKYDLSIPRFSAQNDALRLAMVSDIHLGSIIMQDRLSEIIDDINALSADIVLLGGDIFVEDTSAEQLDYALSALDNLEAPLGVYYVPGNHEYYGSTFDMETLRPKLAQSGVTLLRDEMLLIDNRFYLIGREDLRHGRQPLDAFFEKAAPEKPVIVLDHQPVDLEKGEALGVDLQLSGHTHAGQLFPLGVLTQLAGINEINHGLLTRGHYNLIVSSGIGVWGFPMRVGSPSEIVLVNIS